MKTTLVVCIGNSDNKLTQEEWACFVRRIRAIITAMQVQGYFDGGSSIDSLYQNACFVFDVLDKDIATLDGMLASARKAFRQDSVAVIQGNTRFV